MDNNIPTTPNNNAPKKMVVPLLVAISIILLGLAGYFFYQYQKLFPNTVATQAAALKEAKDLAATVGKLMLLPKDETPTVATVTDIDKIKDQPFFKNASNGDKVLIYPNAKLAVIYNPRANLIINFGPLNFQQAQATPTVTPSPTPAKTK
jgi:hypothetical protein